MLHTLFRRSGPKYERSPFASEMRDFCEWLQQTGYSKDNIRGHLYRLFKVLTRSGQFEPDEARSSAVFRREFGRHCTCVERSQHFRGTERAYCRFLQSQHRLQEEERPADAVSSLLHRYRQHLQEVRGFSETTVVQHAHTVFEFLEDGGLRPGESVRMLNSREHARATPGPTKQTGALRDQTMQHVVRASASLPWPPLRDCTKTGPSGLGRDRHAENISRRAAATCAAMAHSSKAAAIG